MDQSNKITVSKIPNLNVIVIKLGQGSRYFLSTKDSIIISIPNFTALIKYLVKTNCLSIKALEGIISELKE